MVASRPKGRPKNRREDDVRVERMPNEREVTRIYKWKPLASRPKGRPKNRWDDDVRTDLQ
jgi:hypothetical protein